MKRGLYSILAAADGDNDLELVTRTELGRGVLAFRDDLAIALDGDALAGIAQFFNQAGHAQGLWELANFTIDLEFKHRRILARPAPWQVSAPIF